MPKVWDGIKGGSALRYTTRTDDVLSVLLARKEGKGYGKVR